MDRNTLNSVIIVPQKKAMTILQKVKVENSLCYFLSEDYACLVNLRNKLNGQIEIRSLSGLFDETLQEIKEPVLELLSGLNKKHDSFAWWGGQMASKSASASPFFLNIVYLFCAKKLLSESRKNIIFIVDSQALAECLYDLSKEQGLQVDHYRNKFYKLGEQSGRYMYYLAQVGSFFFKIIRNYVTALKASKLQLDNKSRYKKRVIIRSWVTEGAFTQSGEFKDRNFGPLPQWFLSKGYDVWILPMFFNLSANGMRRVYSSMNNSDQKFLIPEHFLKFSDYVRSLTNGYKVFSRRVDGAKIGNTDISLLINEGLKKRGFDIAMCIFNLSCHLLKRLKEKDIEIDRFCYALESNAPEKQFILSCRKYFPNAEIVGFQHTTFFPNQLAYHLGANEREVHPLPDKIVCSGPVYRDLYRKARFPEELLTNGPNLRYTAVHSFCDRSRDVEERKENKKDLLLPLTFSHNLAFDLFMKVKSAVEKNNNYRICIRTHPLLSKEVLRDFLNSIDMHEYIFADEGTWQEWLTKAFAVVSTGGSITVVEAASFGIPVIRVVPDNTIHYDSFSNTDYPLKPVNSSVEIRQQLRLIEEMQKNEKESFKRIAKNVLTDYFTEPSEENLQVFL